MLEEMVRPIVQFGVAGLMGVLWVWERLLSRRREHQLDQAHEKLARQEQELAVLIRLVRHNTRAIERFEQTQVQLIETLERMRHETAKAA